MAKGNDALSRRKLRLGLYSVSAVAIASLGVILCLRSPAALDFAHALEFDGGAVEVANALRWAVIAVASDTQQATDAYEQLKFGIGYRLRYSDEECFRYSWRYVAHEARRGAEGDLEHAAVGCSQALLERNYPKAIWFITRIQERWPRLRQCNRLNSQLITCYGCLGYYEQVIAVFERHVTAAGQSDFTAMWHVDKAYRKLGHKEQGKSLIGNMMEHDTVLGAGIREYYRAKKEQSR